MHAPRTTIVTEVYSARRMTDLSFDILNYRIHWDSKRRKTYLQTTTQPEQQPVVSSWVSTGPWLGIVGRPFCCSCVTKKDKYQLIGITINHTLLYRLISRTSNEKVSSTLARCFADVSMNLQFKCLAKSRPSSDRSHKCQKRVEIVK